MTQYSDKDAYLAAVTMRTVRTLLVEGVSDSRIYSSLVEALRGANSARVYVDNAQMIRAHEGLGNRELVERIHSEAIAEGVPLHSIVDREFREFDLDPTVVDKLSRHHAAAIGLLWTRGHSVESYLFVARYVTECLKFLWPEHVSLEAREAVSRSFDRILRASAAFGLAAKVSGLLSRSSGLLSRSSWTDVAQPRLAETTIEAKFVERGCGPESVLVFREALSRFTELLEREEISLSRWVAHGHVAAEGVWTGVSFVVAEHCDNESSVSAIAHGQGDAKLRLLAGWWADSVREGLDQGPVDFIRALVTSYR
jgi:hypothetical protein